MFGRFGNCNCIWHSSLFDWSFAVEVILMKSAMCSHDEHEVCGKVLTTPSGKHFRCDCECHPKEVKRSFEYEDYDDDDEFEDS